MKKIFIHPMSMLLSILFLAACTKNQLPVLEEEIAGASNNAKKPASISLVKTKVQGNDTRTFSYDGKKRLVSSVSTQFNSMFYEYIGKNTVKNSLYYPGGGLAGQTTYTLNNTGLAVTYTAPGIQGSITYNNQKQVTKKEVFFMGGDFSKSDYTYVNDNITQIQNTYNGEPGWSKTFTYYLDKPNTFGNDAYGQTYLGVESKNLLKSMVFIFQGGSVTENYSYEFDEQGRVSKMTTVQNGVLQPDTFFTYY
jgi:hypothetical protein